VSHIRLWKKTTTKRPTENVEITPGTMIHIQVTHQRVESSDQGERLEQQLPHQQTVSTDLTTITEATQAMAVTASAAVAMDAAATAAAVEATDRIVEAMVTGTKVTAAMASAGTSATTIQKAEREGAIHVLQAAATDSAAASLHILQETDTDSVGATATTTQKAEREGAIHVLQAAATDSVAVLVLQAAAMASAGASTTTTQKAEREGHSQGGHPRVAAMVVQDRTMADRGRASVEAVAKDVQVQGDSHAVTNHTSQRPTRLESTRCFQGVLRSTTTPIQTMTL